VAHLRCVAKPLPHYELPAEVPVLPPEIYRTRYRNLDSVRRRAGYDCFLIYGDREHAGNLAWLTGFGPRFEEALWIQGPSEKPVLIVGNECYDLARAQVQLDAEIYLYQPFGLPGQDQSRSADLHQLLRMAGLTAQRRCGLVGWKPGADIDVPYWIVRGIHEVTGALPDNVASMLTAPPDGLLVDNYLNVVRAWYGRIRCGVAAGEVFTSAVEAKNSLWDFALNPGHLLHLEEWIASPFAAGSQVPLLSGYAVQQDIIPIARRSPATVNMEDGLVLADQDLRQRLRKLDKSLMDRCQMRRAFMENLGYSLSEDILPLSDIAGVFFPFLLEPRLIFSFS
jgi:hypothetical protein